jgi:dephospho-CoA kinase
MIIGIMGRAGSGKTHVQQGVQHLFDDILDLDQLGHKVLLQEDVKRDIKSKFGDDICVDGDISRERLRNQVFSSKDKLEKLNQCIHPIMKAHAEKWAKKTERGLIVGALLYQIKLNTVCHYIITIDATDLEIARHSTNRHAILECQESREWYNSHSDRVLKNTWESSFGDQCCTKIKEILE